MRVGIGYDIHRLGAGRRLFLGGVEFKHSRGLIGHSDADVVLHAISDAMLGALGLGDIGEHFPDTSDEYKDVRSTTILSSVAKLISGKGYSVNNIDTMIIAEEPKISASKKMMIKAISDCVGITEDRISIKATTNEGIGIVGAGEAIASYAVATLKENV